MLVAFIKTTLLREFRIVRRNLKLPALVLFVQGCCKRHVQTLLSLKSLRWENFRWTGLGQKT